MNTVLEYSDREARLLRRGRGGEGVRFIEGKLSAVAILSCFSGAHKLKDRVRIPPLLANFFTKSGHYQLFITSANLAFTRALE